jgi:UrcA family protein
MEIRNHLRNLALLAGAALLPAGAMAAPLNGSTITRTETVRYSIPEAHTAAGADALYRKLSDAASRVCSTSESDAPFFYAVNTYESCFTKALDKAVRQVNIANVTALYQENKANGRLASTTMPATEAPQVVANR